MNINMGMNPNNIVLSNKKNIKQELGEQSVYLKQLIDKYLKDYRRSFVPSEYERTGSLEQSVVVSDIKSEGGSFVVYVYFNEKAVHRSGFGAWGTLTDNDKYGNDIQSFESDNSVNVALLINNGYMVRKPVWFADIPNFGFRRGNGFIDKAVEEFNATNTLGIRLGAKYITNDRKW